MAEVLQPAFAGQRPATPAKPPTQKNAITMPQQLRITKVLNGHIVEAGCQTLVFNNPDEFAAEMVSWIKDPEKTEEKYRKMMPMPIPPPPMGQEVNRLRGVDPMPAQTACEAPCDAPRATR